MKWSALVGLGLSIASCQHGDVGEQPARTPPRGPSAVTTAYRADIDALCDVVRQSGADHALEGDRPMLTAMWLSSHLETNEAHDYLVSIQPLEGEHKARALEAEAHRVGLPGCALAAQWRSAK
jgi:hypothetical protein